MRGRRTGRATAEEKVKPETDAAMAVLDCRVVAEEILSRYQEPNNGAGPMWCYGSPALVRDGGTVFASVPAVGRNVPPLCNTRWQLFRRPDGARWERVAEDPGYREREPCPLARLGPGQIVLSTNPAVRLRERAKDGTERFFCQPRLLLFRSEAPSEPAAVLTPDWGAEHAFTEHSYRGVSADPRVGHVLLLHIVEGRGQAWCLMDREGATLGNGLLRFPLRACYPQVALRGRAAYVLAVSDVVEPVPAWRDFKRKVTGREWDYDFRNLFFTWTPDVTEEPFSPILTVASRDETAGYLRNPDLYVDAEGDAHVLYLDRNIWHASMREKFFPGLEISIALKYCRIRRGQVVARRTLVLAEEDTGPRSGRRDATGFAAFVPRGPVPTCAAFHATPDGHVLALYHLDGAEAGRPEATGIYALQLLPVPDRAPVRLNLTYPLHTFFCASTRAGGEPADVIDLYGLGPDPLTIGYAQVAVGRRQEPFEEA